jgi:FtsH-binding integral membrane protein
LVLAPYPSEVTERGRRRVVGALLTGAMLLVVSAAAWLLDRSLLASDTRPAYYEHEAAFALADAWLAFLLVAAARSLRARRATALLWLLAAAGAGGFLLATDVLYNHQHGVWFASQRGLLELVRNLATGAGTYALFSWTWPRRAQLLAGD